MLPIVHWASAVVFAAIFGYAGLWKILKIPGMVEGMQSMGFNLRWTLLIGWVETLGIFAFVLGLFLDSPLKNAAILLLWPFAIGALTTHFAFQHDFGDFKNALIVTILPLVLLATDSRFRIYL